MLMNVLGAITARRSCRHFTSEPLSNQEAVTMMVAARNTPSAGGIRPLTIYECRNMAALARSTWQSWFPSAATAFVILADFAKIERKYRRRGRQYALLEAGHAAQNICLAATELGLGSCCVGAFRESRVLQALGLERNCGLTPVYMVVVGRKK